MSARDDDPTDLTPELDGAPVTRAVSADGALRHTYADGRPVPPERERDVVYVARARRGPWWEAVPVDDDGAAPGALFAEPAPGPVTVGDEEWSASDVEALLSAVPGPPSTRAGVVGPGFFHTTLQFWLGEAPPPAHGVAWPYGFWAASIEPVDVEAPRPGAAVYEARVFRGERTEGERFRYWLVVGAEGRIDDEGWLDAPPDLLALDAASFPSPPEVTAADLFATLDDDAAPSR